MIVYDCIVIGGGPGGTFAAINLGNSKKKVLLLEKNSKIGKKLLVAGQGRCNLTNSALLDKFILAYGDKGKFIKAALYKFKPDDLKSWFKNCGLPLTLMEGTGKYFPNTFSSKDVIELLERELKKNKVELKGDSEVIKVTYENNLYVVKTKNEKYQSKNLIIGTGGKSYQGVGTTGDGYKFARDLGHKIQEITPALTPVYMDNYPFSDLSGISFKNMEIKLVRDGKLVKKNNGSVLLTHHNLSGPLILDMSRNIKKGDSLILNFLNLKSEEFNELFLEYSKDKGKNQLKTFFLQNDKIDLPERFIKKMAMLLELDLNKKVSEITKKERESILKISKYEVKVTRVGGFDIAMATSGGVDLSEINSKTMESKIRKGLFFVGEVLDIDGDTGGYNIQAAFSTGYLAAETIKKQN